MPHSSVLTVGLEAVGRRINISCLSVTTEKGKQAAPAANDKPERLIHTVSRQDTRRL